MYPERTPTRGGRVSLSAARGYRGESGRNRQRAYETFGFVDELEGEFDDPVADRVGNVGVSKRTSGPS